MVGKCLRLLLFLALLCCHAGADTPLDEALTKLARRDARLLPDERTLSRPRPSARDPIELHVAWWGLQNYDRPPRHVRDLFGEARARPDAATCKPLLEACKRNPHLLPDLLNALPEDAEIAREVHQIYRDNVASRNSEWSSQVKAWLMTHGPWFRDELVQGARGAKAVPNNYDGDPEVQGTDYIEALQRLDPRAAAPILERGAASDSPALAVYCLSQMYASAQRRHDAALVQALRARLQRTIARGAPSPFVVDTGVEALMASDWPGRDAWYLGLFSDRRLRIDPSTGEKQLQQGDVRPWLDTRARPLQKTDREDFVWAAIPSGDVRPSTTVGRYNTRYFIFEPVREYAGINFSSDDMWVDERAGKIYVVYSGHLLRLPLGGR